VGVGRGNSCFVPHTLTVEQKEDQVAACQDLIEMAVSDPASFKSKITDDKSWCFAYDPAMKQHSSAWVEKKFAVPTETLIPEVKTMLVIFFNWQGVMHKEFVLDGQTVNFEFYREGMDQLMQRLRCVTLLIVAAL
jgi:hypothetical protein